MDRARSVIHADWVPDALSRSRWGVAHALRDIESARAEATGERRRAISGACEALLSADNLLAAAQSMSSGGR